MLYACKAVVSSECGSLSERSVVWPLVSFEEAGYVYLCINSHFPGEPGLDGATWFSPSPYTLFHKRTLGDKCHRFFWPGTQPTVSKQWRKQSADTNQCSGVILFYLPPDCWWNVIAFFRQLSDAITNIWGAEVLKLTVEKTSWFYAQIVITTDH